MGFGCIIREWGGGGGRLMMILVLLFGPAGRGEISLEER